MITDRELLMLEQRRRTALVLIDKAALRALLSDDLIFTHTNGHCEGKASFIDSLGGAVRFLHIETVRDDVLVRGDMGIVSAHISVTVQTPDQDRPFQLQNRILSVWAAEPLGWRLQAYQATKIV